MKKTAVIVVVSVISSIFNLSFAQTPQDSWSFGFGVKYPRFISTGLTPQDNNLGIFMDLQRDFTENAALRLNGNYLQLNGKSGGVNQKVNMLALNYDILYNFSPCQSVSPYIVLGVGNIYYKFNQQIDPALAVKYRLDYQFNAGLGFNWTTGEDWKLMTEFDYHTAANSQLDGISNAGNGLLGGPNDTYVAFQLGFQYYFSKGEPSKLCDLYSGVSAKTSEIDYDRIESLMKKYQAKPVDNVDYGRIESIVKNSTATITPTTVSRNWMLIGVNFAPNSAKFKTEAYPILFHSLDILLQNPDLKVEVQGYTDDRGPDMFNLNLSLERANAVKDYMVQHGIGPERLTTVGLGSSNPLADNKTAAGRLLNRRIEFKVLGK